MSGPLPDRNAPHSRQTVPLTILPTTGLARERRPKVPRGSRLGPAGRAWWRWAWAQPQAVGWGVGVGMESALAHRARLEDEMAEATDARTRLAVGRQMVQYDDRFGLTAKGLAALRWQIVADTEGEEKAAAGPATPRDEVGRRRDRRDRLGA